MPDNFDGIPVLNNLKATFYGFKDGRKMDDIDNIWNLFEAAINFADNDDEENPEDILDTKWGYNEDEKYKYFEPGKKTGTVKLVGKFEKNDGTVYEDTMTVTVEENNDPTVLALENAYTYFGLLDTDGKSVDTNGDGQIDEKEIKNVKQMNLYLSLIHI